MQKIQTFSMRKRKIHCIMHSMTRNENNQTRKHPYLHITARFCIALVFFVLLIAVILIPLFSRGVLKMQLVTDRSTLPPTLLSDEEEQTPSPAADAATEETPEASAPSLIPDSGEPTSSPEARLILSQYSTLKLGDDNASVEKLQQRLMELGYLDQDEPSTLFNESIQNAVILFQRACSIEQTGVADEQMQTTLFSENAQAYQIKESDAGADVLNLQQRLAELGYYSGRSNGYFGPMTVEAVKNFQSQNHLSVSGILSYEDWEVLYSHEAEESDIFMTPTPVPTKKATAKPRPASTEKPDATSKPKKTAKPTATPAPDGNVSSETPAPDTTTPVPGSEEPGGDSTMAPEETPFVPSAPEYTPEPTAAPTKKPSSSGSASYACSTTGLCQAAADQLGKPYVWGNKGPDSFDCSGMVYYCLKSCGLKVSRTNAASYAKKDSWKLVENISDLKKGDLVFFKSDTEDRVSHTGIYIGGGSFIHASSSSGKVITSSMSGSYWTRNFVCGRRVF